MLLFRNETKKRKTSILSKLTFEREKKVCSKKKLKSCIINVEVKNAFSKRVNCFEDVKTDTKLVLDYFFPRSNCSGNP